MTPTPIALARLIARSPSPVIVLLPTRDKALSFALERIRGFTA